MSKSDIECTVSADSSSRSRYEVSRSQQMYMIILSLTQYNWTHRIQTPLTLIEYKLKVFTTTHLPYPHNLISVQPHSTRSSSLVTDAGTPTLSFLVICAPCLCQPHPSLLLTCLFLILPHLSLCWLTTVPSITPSLIHSWLKTYLFHKYFPSPRPTFF